MGVVAMQQQWRPHRRLVPADDRTLNRQRQKDVRIFQSIMVKKVSRGSVKIGLAHGPTVNGNRDAILLLNVPFPVQWEKCAPITSRIVDQRT